MRAVVLGGTGAVGSAVVAALRERGLEVASLSRTGDLAADFRDPEWIGVLDGESADVVVHCAASVSDPWAVNYRAVVDSVDALDPHRVVVASALLPNQSLPVAPEFAASWGALNAWVKAAAKARAPGWVVGVAVGPLETGLSTQLAPELLADFERFSALRRRGTAAEVASAIAWLVVENTWITGQIVPVNGGLT